MSPGTISYLGTIAKTIYKPNGEIRSFLIDHGNGYYSLYCKEVHAWNVSISIEQIEEILELLKSPITEPNKEELQKY